MRTRAAETELEDTFLEAWFLLRARLYLQGCRSKAGLHPCLPQDYEPEDIYKRGKRSYNLKELRCTERFWTSLQLVFLLTTQLTRPLSNSSSAACANRVRGTSAVALLTNGYVTTWAGATGIVRLPIPDVKSKNRRRVASRAAHEWPRGPTQEAQSAQQQRQPFSRSCFASKLHFLIFGLATRAKHSEAFGLLLEAYT